MTDKQKIFDLYSEAKQEDIQKSAGFGYWEWNIIDGEAYWSSGMLNLLKLDPKSFTPTPESIGPMVHPDDRDRFFQEMYALKSGIKLDRSETRFYRTDGRMVYLKSRCVFLRDEAGQITSIFAVVFDVTPLKTVENELRKERKKTLKAQELAHFGYWDWDIASGDVVWSDEIYRIFGLSKDSFKPHIDKVMAVTHPDDARMSQRLIEEAIKTHSSGNYEMRIFRPDGEIRCFESSFEPFFDKNDNLVRIMGTAHDITARKVAEDDAAKREEQLRVTLSSIGEGVIATDAECRIVRMNPVASSLTGFTEEDAVGKHLSEVFRIVDGETGESNMPDISHILQDGHRMSLKENTILIASNGAERLVADSMSPIVGKGGDIQGIVIIFRDITEKRKLEERLTHGQKMESIGQLAGGVAHDFNNMLGGILGAAELLQLRIGGNSKNMELLNMITSAADQAAELTQQLLTFSRKGKILSTPIDIHQAIKDSLAILKRSINRQIKIDCQLDAPDFMMVGDPTLIQNSMINLGVNASHAMPEGGKLSISTRNVSLTPEECNNFSQFSLQPGDYIEIAVKDTGRGIPEDIQPKIFEPFFTTKQVSEGTGLGLAAVYGTVKDHRGAIRLQSEIDKGTTFFLIFPIEKNIYPQPKKQEEIVSGSGTVLVVDDELILLRTGQIMLEDLGYNTLTASNGREALTIFEQKKEEIDVVLLDMIMPELSGKECFEKIREISPQMPVVLCSGFSRTISVNDLLKNGASAFIKKPYRKFELSLAIHNAISKTS